MDSLRATAAAVRPWQLTDTLRCAQTGTLAVCTQ